MKCQNKREQLSNKFICHPEQQMWCQNKGQTYVIITDIIRYYYSHNNLLL
jgi:hypothetical protein